MPIAANKSLLVDVVAGAAVSVEFVPAVFVAAVFVVLGSLFNDLVWLGVKGMSVITPSSVSEGVPSIALASFAPNKSSAVSDFCTSFGLETVGVEPNNSSAVECVLSDVNADPGVAAAGELKSGLSILVDAPAVASLALSPGGLAKRSSALCERL